MQGSRVSPLVRGERFAGDDSRISPASLADAVAPGAVRLLAVEAVEHDALALVRELRCEGFDVRWSRVETAQDLLFALDGEDPELVLCDASVPGLSVVEVLRIVRESGRDVPVVVVSAVLDDEIVADAFRAGARDFVLKSKLVRLAPAVARELREARDRRRRRAAERALRESEERLRTLLEVAPDGFVTLDDRGRVVQANTAALRMLGCSQDELLGTPWATRLVTDETSAAAASVVGSFASGQTTEITLRAADGTRVQAEARSAQWAEGSGSYTALVLRDVTERRALEAQLQRAQRMEAVGQLAGGVAHDFNNVLGLIMSYTVLVQGTMEPGDERLEDLGQIVVACRRAANIIRQLLTFAKRDVVRRTILHLRDLVPDVEGMIRPFLGSAVRWATCLEEDAPIFADVGQMEQVLLNLTMNARDAMPGGGVVTIRSRDVLLAAPRQVLTGLLEAGAYVTLEVDDTGTGIRPEVMPHLFEPFFTTKGSGKGTGLGLCTVYGIVQQMGGQMDVRTEVGRGTTCTVYFPRARSGGGTSRRAYTAPPPRREVPGLVVLVEDEAEARVAMATLLEQGGLEVRSFGDAEAALAFIERDPSAVDVVVSDVLLPGQSGIELVRELLRRWPALHCVLVSGYTPDEGRDIPPGVRLLTKPVEPAQLLAHVVRAGSDAGSAFV